MDQRFKKHIFVCVNERPPESPKGCCAHCHGEEIRVKFVQMIRSAGLKGQVRANKSGCLDACEIGASVVIYPLGVWYTGVQAEDVEEIFKTSVLKGEVVERLAATRETWQELHHLRKRNKTL